MAYQVVLSDRITQAPLAEVRNFSSFSFFRGLNKLSTVTFTVRLDNAFVDILSAVIANVKVYRNGTLVLFGPIISAEEQAERESQTLAVTCADAGWMLSRRIAAQGAPYIVSTVTARHTIAKTLIDTSNTAGETGIDTAAIAGSSGSAITHKVDVNTNLLQAVQTLAGALDGFDWIIRPRENWVNGASTSVKIGNLDMQTVIGTTKSNAVFEYGVGTRSNVLSYGMTTTRDGQANKMFHFNSTFNNNVVSSNSTSIGTWGLLEDVADGDFSDPTYRQALVDEHVRVRKDPRTLVRMTPHIDPGVTGRLPMPFVDYDVGDTITARMVHAGKVRFSGLLRVFGIRVTLDEGFERVELILEDDT